jgi:hypothetical protein
VESQLETKYHYAGKVKIKATPSRDELRDVFDYDKVRGCLIRKSTGNPAWEWDSHGRIEHKQRWTVQFGQSKWKHARIVWAWHYGDPGPLQIDHIDGDRRNDRIENLRLATNSQNNANRKGSKGYSFRGGRWCVDVMKDQVSHKGGSFKTEAEAAIVAKALKKALFGEFSNYECQKPTTPKPPTTEWLPLFDGVNS